MNKDNFDLNDLDLQEETPKEEAPKKKSYADLDLGLDFDLSFLDDIDESVLDEPPVPVKKPAPKAAPVKKPAGKEAAAKKAAPAAKEGAAKKSPSAKPAAAQGTTARKAAPADKAAAPAPKKQAPKKQPAPVVQEAPAKPQKRGPRVGGVIFYTLYFMFILIFFVATYIGLQWLHGWLTDYELSQPTVKAEQVFKEVFTDPDWGALYDSAGAQDSPYEGKEEYVTYMENKVGDSKLTYLETSNGLSPDKKYNVHLGSEKVASFTLVDKNKVGTLNLQNLEDLENLTDIPNWTLGAVEVFFEREEIYSIVKLNGYTAYVNGVALDDSFTIQKATTVAEKYLPAGTTGFVMETQQVTGLMEKPDITVSDTDGNPVEVSYDEATRTFTARTESNTMSDEEQKVALEALKIKCLWMIEEEKDRGAIAKYYEPTSEAYSSIVKTTELWMQNHGGYRFENDSVTDYARYSDDIFSVKVSTDLIVTRINGTEKTTSVEQSMFFQKNANGKWLCFEATNVDVSQPVGKVRLTFMQGDTELYSDFFETDAKEVITPKLATQEGQVFTGWVTISENEDGDTVYNLEFQPAEDGTVIMPEGSTLRPMTLYALFQDASEVADIEEVPAETPAAETAAPETTEGA